jgi:hypothetical protein
LRGDHSHRVQGVQLTVAAAHLILGAALLGHVEHETLIAFNVTRAVARRETALDGEKECAILAAEGNVEVPYVILTFDFTAEGFALLGIDTDFRIQIQNQQFFALAVAEHVDEGIVAVDELAGRVGDVNAFLHLFKQETVFLFRGTAVGNVADDVDRAFLRTALLGVRGSGNDGIAAETRVGAFREFFVTTHGAIGAAGPFPKLVGQGGIAGAADHIRGSLAEMFQQNLIGLDDAVIGVVRQDDVVDGVEGIDPLALRTQHLLEQAEVFDCNGKLLGAGAEKLEFFRSPLPAPGTAQHEQSDGRFISCDGDDDKLVNLFARETGLGLGSSGGPRGDLRRGLCQQFLNVFVNLSESGIAQEISGEPHGVSGDQVPAFDQPEPCGLDRNQALQFFHGGLNDVSVLLRGGDAGGDGLHGTQASCPGPSFLEDDEQHAQRKRDFGCQECGRGHAIGERRPGKVKEGQRQSQQPS